MHKNKAESLISVIIPLFGNFDSTKVEMCVDSIREQKGVDIEIIIAEQTKTPKLDKMKGVVYRYIPITLSEDGFFIPGRVINSAAEMATGGFLYSNDGDILFFNKRYLEGLAGLLKRDSNLCLYQPQMRRLPVDNFEEFKKRFREKGLQFAMSTLDLSQPYGATYRDSPVKVRHFIKEKDGKREILVATEGDHRKYLQGANKGKEPLFYTLGVHAGGIFMRKNQFDEVGGYCESYFGWGCQDEDIQWKLKSYFSLQTIPKKAEFEVLHLDHHRGGYFSEDRWKKNRIIQNQRKSEGIKYALDYDLRMKNERR